MRYQCVFDGIKLGKCILNCLVGWNSTLEYLDGCWLSSSIDYQFLQKISPALNIRGSSIERLGSKLRQFCKQLWIFANKSAIVDRKIFSTQNKLTLIDVDDEFCRWYTFVTSFRCGCLIRPFSSTTSSAT